MGATKTSGTMPGALTPICNNCGVALCWDIAEEEYKVEQIFWDKWICAECNGGKPYSKMEFKKLFGSS